MENITAETVKQYFELKDIVENKASEIACFLRDNDLSQVSSFKGSIEGIDIGEEGVEVKFSESWSYGGYDHFWINFSPDLLEKSIEEIAADIELTNAPILAKRIESQKKKAKIERQQDLAKYNELKSKLNK